MGLTESKGEDIVPLEELVKQDLLGHGAMCQVFQAHWTPKNLPVALKQMMVPEVVPEDLADFRRELQLTRTMKHPNLVYLHGGCAEPPNLYLVMELVEHGAASELLRTKTTDLPWPLRFRMAIDTALGMRFLHSQKVMHRDLKTENLLVLTPSLSSSNADHASVNSLQADAETVVKISDLGISRFSEGNEDALMTIGRGTTKWMAPEVLQGSNTYSFPVDVYSFGIILWEFYAQAAPYTEVRSVLRLPQMIIDGYRPPVSHSCPPAYAKLMQDCWHGDPMKRPSFEEITRRLFEMKAEVCPELVVPPPVLAIYEKGEKAPFASPKRPPKADKSDKKSPSSSSNGSGGSGETTTTTAAAATASPPPTGGGNRGERKEKKDKKKEKEKDKEKEKRKTTKKNTPPKKEEKNREKDRAPSSPPSSPPPPQQQQQNQTELTASASVGSMVRRWEGGPSASPSASTPSGLAGAGRTPAPSRPGRSFQSSAMLPQPSAASRGASLPSLGRPARAATVSNPQRPSAAELSMNVPEDKQKKGNSFFPNVFGKKKLESTRD